ncbi:SprT family zinc-dependent metalloprotease [Psychrosphaera aquimarina]|uniref:SprT family zinc-dependent metalloprotease n=1 Tax=Psychrosphaera aquimarina TaxID=2044854 RepID=A0ABU3QXZ4_9GAMM|nr:SprT family zinc-dependent metalloprotease [Psychrosphaera aquimarina]MDU0112285.1 SprT family zinc-dependent metalloprotease [Psychrosphaera aquimarina]
MENSLTGANSSMAADIITPKSHTKTAERGAFYYGNDMIHYDVIRKSQSSKVISSKAIARKVVIKVHPDQRVIATVPHDATDDSIQKAMLKRARWIWQNIEEFAKQKDYILPKRYVSGESQFYLGRRYVLKVLIDSEQVSNVKLSRGKLNVTIQQNLGSINDDRACKIKPLIDRWYQHKAKAIFHERLNKMLPKATWVTDIPSFRVMAMKKQWGSCSTKGNLMLNPHLIKAPKECIDYVILHELCHIAEHNHSEKFWRLLTQVMPNWKEVKAKLDDMAELYLNE